MAQALVMLERQAQQFGPQIERTNHFASSSSPQVEIIRPPEVEEFQALLAGPGRTPGWFGVPRAALLPVSLERSPIFHIKISKDATINKRPDVQPVVGNKAPVEHQAYVHVNFHHTSGTIYNYYL